MRKPQKCPVCGERVVDIIYGTGDMTEIEFVMEYRKEGMMGGDNIPCRPPISLFTNKANNKQLNPKL